MVVHQSGPWLDCVYEPYAYHHVTGVSCQRCVFAFVVSAIVRTTLISEVATTISEPSPLPPRIFVCCLQEKEKRFASQLEARGVVFPQRGGVECDVLAAVPARHMASHRGSTRAGGEARTPF